MEYLCTTFVNNVIKCLIFNLNTDLVNKIKDVFIQLYQVFVFVDVKSLFMSTFLGQYKVKAIVKENVWSTKNFKNQEKVELLEAVKVTFD